MVIGNTHWTALQFDGNTSQICSRFSLLHMCINPKFIKLPPRYISSTEFFSLITENLKHVDKLMYTCTWETRSMQLISPFAFKNVNMGKDWLRSTGLYSLSDSDFCCSYSYLWVILNKANTYYQNTQWVKLRIRSNCVKQSIYTCWAVQVGVILA